MDKIVIISGGTKIEDTVVRVIVEDARAKRTVRLCTDQHGAEGRVALTADLQKGSVRLFRKTRVRWHLR